MKWFKHDSNALSDAKIEKLMLKHGLEGYGFYFACLELIANRLTPDDCEFILEHDIEVLANKFKKKPEKIKELLETCIETGLFQYDTDSKCILCLNLAKRLDNTLAQNPEIKKMITGDNFKKIKETLNDLKQIRLDKIRLDKIKLNKLNCTPVETTTEEKTDDKIRFRDKINKERWAKYKDNIVEVICEYNDVRKKKLIPHTENYVQLLSVLFDYGYTKEQCVAVINYMWTEWQTNDKMAKYHRPETLFAYTNFQKYLPEALEWLEKKDEKKAKKEERNIPVEIQRDPELAKKKLKEIREALGGKNDTPNKT